MARTPEDLFRSLTELGIETQTCEHPPLFTVEESRSLRGEIPGLHSKNLFLRDRARRYFLIVLEEATSVDLRKLPGLIGAQGKLSFGSTEALLDLWGVTPGSVTPFGAINDPQGLVTVVLDARLAEASAVSFHPLVNSRTTTVSGPDLLRFLIACGHAPLLLSLQEA
jgi:Ala-tRNA(Pro) deacylase